MTAPEHERETADFEEYGQPLTLVPPGGGFVGVVSTRRPSKIPFFDDSVIDASAITHILDGESEFTGSHRFTSGVLGKTVFPEDWTDDQIVAAVRAVVRRPAFQVWVPPRLYLRAIVRDVIVEVALRKSRGRLIFKHAYPTSGTGVFRNDRFQRTALPLDLRDLER